jgi:hypothetical protein
MSRIYELMEKIFTSKRNNTIQLCIFFRVHFIRKINHA